MPKLNLAAHGRYFLDTPIVSRAGYHWASYVVLPNKKGEAGEPPPRFAMLDYSDALAPEG